MIANLLNKAWVLMQIAWRNLFASPINLIIGLVILFGTVLVVVGGAMLDSLDTAMSRSVVGSVAGHIQVYSAKSKDEVSLYGGMGGEPDLSAMTEFPRIKQVLEQHPLVKTVVPMGTSGALITSGNTVDLTLERLRTLYKERDGQVAPKDGRPLSPEESLRQIASAKAHVRQIIKVLEGDVKNAVAMADQQAIEEDAPEHLQRAVSEAFWEGFDQAPYASLEFLENKIAPLASDADMLFIRYVGTDLDAFQQSFDRMQIVDGTLVPKGQRGFLVAKFFYEEEMKLRNARRLDKIKEALETDAKKRIATDPVLERYVKENASQTRDIVLQLDGLKTQAMVLRLQKFLGSSQTDLEALLRTFFQTDDQNFMARYHFFYEQLAPMLELYRLKVGDQLTIKAFTRAGYVQSVSVKIYGTFNFKGLEKSPLAGGVSLMDLMSFRDLYGYLTTDKAEELKALKEQAGTKDVAREDAEAELFGGGNEVVAEATAGVIDEAKELTGSAKALRNEDLVRRVYSREEIESGVVLNAAVILKDPNRIDEALLAINQLSEAEKLEVKAISWQKAAGLLGNFIMVAKTALFFVVAIIFVIAMIIINNAMMMATLQRTQTIGTMRAIGAQRGFVLHMVMLETALLGLAFGAAGMLVGTGVMAWLGHAGIPAWNDYSYFFFSGPRLLPTLTGGNLVAALVIILLVSSFSTFTPALMATRVSPLRAMQSDE